MIASTLNNLGGLILCMTLADRIKEAMGAKTPAEIARATKRSPAAVTQWTDGSTKSLKAETADLLEKATGYRASWIITGKGPKTLENVQDGPAVRGLVPLISWVQAGQWTGVIENLPPCDAEHWMPCIAAHSQLTYALRVRGDSMTAPSGNSRTYPENCIIFVDPEKRCPINGNRVIAKLASSDEVTFKVYKDEDGRKWLQPLNPSHEPIRDEFSILGTIIGKWEDE